MHPKEEKYSFKPYSETYPQFYQKEASKLSQCLPKVVQLHHIGSTAIKGLGGKGIIDILLVCKMDDFECVKKALSRLGYTLYKQYSTTTRYFFKRVDPAFPCGVIHLHLVFLNNSEIEEFLFFRDYLREHDDLCQKYEELKRKSSISEEYRKNKSPFVERILSKRNKS